jgi:transposase
VPEDKRVYVDESGIDQHMQRERGRAKRGVKVESTKSGRRYKRKNIIGGMCGGKYLAVQCYWGTTKSRFFEDWFENVLIPESPAGATIIMDNASFHRKAKLREIAEKYKVRLLFLPAYSPDFNRIEHTWANLKSWLKDNAALYASLSTAIFEYFFGSLFPF